VTDPTPAVPEHTDPTSASDQTVPAQRAETQAFDPWSREAATVGVSASDVAAAFPQQTDAFPQAGAEAPTAAYSTGLPPAYETAPVKPKRRRTPIVLAIAAVLVILVGAGAYAGVRYYTGGGISEPESAMPATVTAFARIDLNPGLRDKLSFNSLVKKFPSNGKSSSDLVTSWETKVAKAAGLNYDTDVKPWFGGQAGVAEWTNASGGPVALLAFASKDDAQAKAALAKVAAKQGGSFGYVVRNGYALIAGADSGAQADATAASNAASSASLAGSATYKSTVSHLSGHNLFIAYVNLAKLGSVLGKAMGSLGSLGSMLPLPGAAGSALNSITGDDGLTGLTGAGNPMSAVSGALAKLSGTIAVGGSVAGDGVEIRVHAQSLPGDTSGKSTNVRSTMDAMPASTTVGLAVDGVDPASASGKKIAGQLDGLLKSTAGSSPDSSMLSALSGPLTAVIESKVISLSFSGISNNDPTGYIAVDARDAASAQSIMSTLNQLTGGAGPVSGLKAAQNGNHVQVTLGSPGSGKLADSSLYKETTAGMSNESTMAYIDVTKLVSLASTGGDLPDKAYITPIKAIALGGSSTGTSQDELIRIIVK
jgi:hypothetical protein